MFQELRDYLFPPRRIQDRLPLLSRKFSSPHTRHTIDPEPDDLEYMRALGVVRTTADARRALAGKKKEDARAIARELRRNRKNQSRVGKAIRRFKELFK